MNYDVAIIGGSYAGLAAGLPLGRARRKVVIIDAGQRRNRFADHSHGFLTQDGTLASEIVQIAKQQLLQYPTVDWIDGQVKRLEKKDDLFHICIDGTQAVSAKRIIIATGVQDQLPEIKGLEERWGKSIFHCPYCHGYELNQGKIGLIASSEHSAHMAMLLPEWGSVTYFLNGQPLAAEVEAQLIERNVVIEKRPVAEIIEHSTVVLSDQNHITFEGIFVTTQCVISQDWIHKLACELEHNPMGQMIKTNALKETSISGVFACGDVARLGGSVSLAVGDGTMAGVAAHRSLVF
ncbi:NAD(P)/FAD-dependent oxidoreductase [Acinetobacter haemolyticus]|uniref:NAD(P)/FAD-dependent oxidoreductase n=2 Tax=Acinetobacter haemolyticus TaxID=29430 RepID=A0AAJ2YVN8_ACIHA|nr:NAD(P)/FAD-dependent oxidoreductase [Acinetobacter haemolyticus]ATZ67103.1 thioredoxin reductase [Acinetobacter haemolyticus]NAR19342.1 NAD(P)/FAD-dependent oxidoreductase [Acinetobacter haemolyticus]NAR30169.1 NAD(P)/FAD-dependent oxidoreductase [Acinetobacter haemolyticus]NAR37390.1 NAD(P)/FAD-dependent oxidoreductase [Acinetobacter haemolyticus]NAR48472.1 NAD(P)/FAD-dependent oxidoreductase [Acinetobacter haemolyticus]